jgi:hypothetical protein
MIIQNFLLLDERKENALGPSAFFIEGVKMIAKLHP